MVEYKELNKYKQSLLKVIALIFKEVNSYLKTIKPKHGALNKEY